MLLSQLDMPAARYAFCIPRHRRDMSNARGIYLISIRGFAENISQNANISSSSGWGSPKRRMSFGRSQRSENISNSSFVNIFHEGEYIDRKKNESKNRRIFSFYSCSFCRYKGLGGAALRLVSIFALDQSNAMLALSEVIKFSA